MGENGVGNANLVFAFTFHFTLLDTSSDSTFAFKLDLHSCSLRKQGNFRICSGTKILAALKSQDKSPST